MEDLDKTSDLVQIYPNPFSQSTQIEYNVNVPSRVDISIYNICGQKVKVVINKEESEGAHAVYWSGTKDDGTLAPSGIYICRIFVDGDKTVVKKIVLRR